MAVYEYLMVIMEAMKRLDFGEGARDADKLITKFVKSGSSLDIGCNDGRRTVAYLSANGFKATGIDVDATAIIKANKIAKDGAIDAKFVCVDFLDYKPNKKFDVITMHFVLQFAKENEKEHILNKMTELTNINGINVITFFNEMNPSNCKKEAFGGFERDIRQFYIKKGWVVEYYKEGMEGNLAIGGNSKYSIIIARRRI